MKTVKFGDVVKEVKNNVDRANNPYEYYVAGDHMDSEELKIHRRGCFATDDVGPAFIRIFKPGQVLYGSRRTYLKKVAVADFEGVTANTTFVLESKDQSEFLQELLPYVMLTENFTDWSILHSKGSTNPYVLFSDLANYEFQLPDIQTQEQLKELLLAMERTKTAYKNLIAQTDELVKARFIEMFGDPESNPFGWEQMPLSSIVVNSNNGITRRGNDPDGQIVLRIAELQDGYIDYSNVNRIATRDKEQKCLLINRDLLFVRVNGNPDYVGRSAVYEDIGEPVYHNDHIIRVHIDEQKADVVFVRGFTTSDYGKKQLKDNVKTSAGQYSISQDGICGIQIYLPPIKEQERYVEFVRQSDKSIFAAQQALADLTGAQKALMRQYLG